MFGALADSYAIVAIMQGYGQRVSHRDHQPGTDRWMKCHLLDFILPLLLLLLLGGFSLELGLKDVTLVSKAAREADVPMPFLSTLLDRLRYISSLL